jgi:hypothetical protein
MSLQVLEPCVQQALDEISIHDVSWPAYLAEVIQRNGFRLVPQNPSEIKPLRLTQVISSISRSQEVSSYIRSLASTIYEHRYALIATKFDGGTWELHSRGMVLPEQDSSQSADPAEPDARTYAIIKLCGLPEEWEFPTEQARRVCVEILPGVLALFLRKNRDYRENAQTLGHKGQFADIHRKYTKLYLGWWEGIPLESEPAEEVAADMIAHLLLGLLFVADEESDDE